MSRAPALYLVADRGFLGSDEAWLERTGRVAEAISGLVTDVPGGEPPDGSAGPGLPEGPVDTAPANGRLAADAANDGLAVDPSASVMLQLRVKDLPGPDRRLLLVEGLERARAAGIPVLLNGTEDEARDLGFDGVHWPESLVPPSRPAAKAAGEGPAFLRSASVHSVDAARLAAAAGADFLVFGPVFAPGSKPGSGVGIAALEEVVQAARVPVVAIGGVTARRARACRAAGAWGVAVVSAVFSPDVPAATAVRTLLAAVRDRTRR